MVVFLLVMLLTFFLSSMILYNGLYGIQQQLKFLCGYFSVLHIKTLLIELLHFPQINGSLARRAIKDLMARGAIRMISAHASQQIYTRATNTQEEMNQSTFVFNSQDVYLVPKCQLYLCSVIFITCDLSILFIVNAIFFFPANWT